MTPEETEARTSEAVCPRANTPLSPRHKRPFSNTTEESVKVGAEAAEAREVPGGARGQLPSGFHILARCWAHPGPCIPWCQSPQGTREPALGLSNAHAGAAPTDSASSRGKARSDLYPLARVGSGCGKRHPGGLRDSPGPSAPPARPGEPRWHSSKDAAAQGRTQSHCPASGPT